MSKSINVANPELERYINAKATVRGESFDTIVMKMLEKQMKDEQYRTRRNAQKWQETKALKETVEALEAQLIEINRQREEE